MKNYIVGLLTLFILSLGIYFLVNVIDINFPKISLLESWAILSILMIIYSGIGLYLKRK
jgi:membrane protein DedA with SNARE-associated domain